MGRERESKGGEKEKGKVVKRRDKKKVDLVPVKSKVMPKLGKEIQKLRIRT